MINNNCLTMKNKPSNIWSLVTPRSREKTNIFWSTVFIYTVCFTRDFWSLKYHSSKKSNISQLRSVLVVKYIGRSVERIDGLMQQYKQYWNL